jgi:dUTP pyrophosphatase
MDETVEILVKVDEGGIVPTKAHDDDAAYDLYTPIDFSLDMHDKTSIDLKVHMVIPSGYCGEIISKSGLSDKYGITCVGLVDAGYTGSIKAMMYRDDPNCRGKNFGPSYTRYHFKKGDKITQIKISKVPNTKLKLTDILPDTERGTGGFGSSGR